MRVTTARGEIDIDAAARQAKLESSGPRVDFIAEGLPGGMAHWNIAVEPKRPKSMSDGGIALASTVEERQAIQITVGRVIQCGPSAFEGKTSSGIPLNVLAKGVERPEDLIGRYIVHQRFTGLQLTVRRTGQKVLFITNTEILFVFDKGADPDYFEFYL